MKNIFVFLLFISLSFAQAIFSEADKKICEEKLSLEIPGNISEKSLSEIISLVAKSFVNVDYKANTLQTDGKEKLVINLGGLDCYTFVEASLAISRMIREGKKDFSEFIREVENLRYRNGKLVDYPSRLHYLTDWGYDLERRGILKNITKQCGGQKYDKVINFMSTHTQSYKELKNNPEFVKDIEVIEDSINSRRQYFIYEDDISKIEKKIMSGDIIGITTDIDGLDVSHTGFAIRKEDGQIYLLHAPSPGKKIQITEKTLSEYIKANKKQTGIIIYRAD